MDRRPHRRGEQPRPGRRRKAAQADNAPAGGGLPTVEGTWLRIIGGTHRGRRLKYTGDLRTRPMKDRVREALFNLLGPGIAGSHAIDLFAGSGALGLEALSRGAARATFCERHFPTAAVIDENVRSLGFDERAEVLPGDTLIRFRRRIELAEYGEAMPWTVFVSPPYDLYVEQREAMLKLIGDFVAASPVGSVIAVEADERFDFSRLPQAERWQVRAYRPAVLGILRL